MLVCLFTCLSVSLPVRTFVCTLHCHFDPNVKDICPVCRSCIFNSLLVSKADLCHSLHTGRPASAEASHVDGGNCGCHIWNLLDA